MKILYTAFKGKNNTSFQLVSQFNVECLFLTNSFQGLEKEIVSLSEHFDMVVMFGADNSLRNQIRIEKCAVQDSDAVVSKFHIEDLEHKCKQNHIDYAVSEKPTGYLCNAAYYHMLKKVPKTVFIHIPSIKWMNAELMRKLMCFEKFF